MKNKKDSISFTKIEKVFIFIFIIFCIAIKESFSHYLVGGSIAIATTLLLSSTINLIKNIEAVIKQKFNIKRYGLFTLISYFLGSIILFIVILFEFKISLKTIFITLTIVFVFALINLSLFYLNKLIINRFCNLYTVIENEKIEQFEDNTNNEEL